MNRRVLIMTGDGKGKTTAALGLALRAVGHGQRVAFVRFIKADSGVGEVAGLLRLGVEVLGGGGGFYRATCPRDVHHNAALRALETAGDCLSGGYDLVVLDEVLVAVACGLLAEEAVIDLVRDADRQTTIALTGRGASPGLLALADTVTDMVAVRHAYDQGRQAQVGVER